MSKVRRFFYVGPAGEVAKIHLSFAPHFVEGEKTLCGRRFEAGWHYWLGLRNVPKNRAICAQCSAA